jgi:putative NADH-flavin reductase
VVAQSSLDWILVRPGVLTDRPKRGAYRHGVNVGSFILTGTISRADVADFMLKQLTNDQYLRRAAAILG